MLFRRRAQHVPEASIPAVGENIRQREASMTPAPGRTDVLDTIEADIRSLIDGFSASIATARSDVVQMQAGLAGIRTRVTDLAAAVDLAERTGGLSSSSARIGEAMGQAGGHLDQAGDRGTEARALIAALAEAGNEIASIVDTISVVARQTNLLALNATMEAVRAGAALPWLRTR